MKLRGVPESVLPNDLHKYADDLFGFLLPDISQIERMVDRIHCIPKPKRFCSQGHTYESPFFSY